MSIPRHHPPLPPQLPPRNVLWMASPPCGSSSATAAACRESHISLAFAKAMPRPCRRSPASQEHTCSGPQPHQRVLGCTHIETRSGFCDVLVLDFWCLVELNVPQAFGCCFFMVFPNVFDIWDVLVESWNETSITWTLGTGFLRDRKTNNQDFMLNRFLTVCANVTLTKLKIMER